MMMPNDNDDDDDDDDDTGAGRLMAMILIRYESNVPGREEKRRAL